MDNTLIFFATFNEVGNIESLLRKVSTHVPNADILVVDDSSSDGTGDLIRSLDLSNVTVLVRKGKLGLGTAHLLAFAYARHFGYDVLVTMDADMSHDPACIPVLLAKIEDEVDICIGSRYMKGGSCDYSGYRLYVSKLGNIAARSLLRIPIHEFTTSFRAMRVAALTKIDWSALLVGGYSFFLTVVAEANSQGLRIGESPIHFHERGYGTSKIPAFEVFRGISNLLRLSFNKVFSSPRRRILSAGSLCPQCDCQFSLIEKVGDARHGSECVMCGTQQG